VNRLEKRRLLAGGEVAPGTHGKPGDAQWTDADAAQPLDRYPDRVHDVPHQVVRSLVDYHLQDQTFRRLPQNSELFGDDAVTRDDDPVAHAL
jgi:hypothetical protein